jgi:N-dimethylarginine dimethylaminohydrolase
VTTTRQARARRYLMCRPAYFSVDYAINPWMDLSTPVDRDRAVAQWEVLRSTYLSLGHSVDLIEPEPGLPDMVFAANGALVVDGAVYGAQFTHPERVAEGPAYLSWFEAQGFDPVYKPEHVNEGEGDLLTVGGTILAGTGFRTDPAAHREVAELLGRPVVPLELVDPRFYHLDTALSVLDDTTVAYYPGAFAPHSQARLRALFPDALLASREDAEVLGLNAVSDGRHVVVAPRATGFADQLRRRGFEPVPVDLSELLKAGGGAKCCTLEIRS